jgi:DNA polymerase-3 subunit alpha
LLRANAEENPDRNCLLRFSLSDYEEGMGKIGLEMNAKSLKIFPSNEFLQHVEELENVTYKLN